MSLEGYVFDEETCEMVIRVEPQPENYSSWLKRCAVNVPADVEAGVTYGLSRPRMMSVPDFLLRELAKAFKTTVEELKGQSRRRDLVAARSVFCRILKERNPALYSYPKIGKQLGGRDHSTIMNSLDKFEVYAKIHPEVLRAYEALSDDGVLA